MFAIIPLIIAVGGYSVGAFDDVEIKSTTEYDLIEQVKYEATLPAFGEDV